MRVPVVFDDPSHVNVLFIYIKIMNNHITGSFRQRHKAAI